MFIKLRSMVMCVLCQWQALEMVCSFFSPVTVTDEPSGVCRDDVGLSNKQSTCQIVNFSLMHHLSYQPPLVLSLLF